MDGPTELLESEGNTVGIRDCGSNEVFEWRRLTRYDRTARNFLSALALAATLTFWAK